MIFIIRGSLLVDRNHFSNRATEAQQRLSMKLLLSALQSARSPVPTVGPRAQLLRNTFPLQFISLSLAFFFFTLFLFSHLSYCLWCARGRSHLNDRYLGPIKTRPFPLLWPGHRAGTSAWLTVRRLQAETCGGKKRCLV